MYAYAARALKCSNNYITPNKLIIFTIQETQLTTNINNNKKFWEELIGYFP
jgi:hypothetical protein